MLSAWRIPEGTRSLTVFASELDDQALEFPRPVEREEMIGIAHDLVRDARDEGTRVLPLAGRRPIPVAIDQQHGQFDVVVLFTRPRPYLLMFEQAQKGLVMTGPIADLVNLLCELSGQRFARCAAALHDPVGQQPISQSYDRGSQNGDARERQDQPSGERTLANAARRPVVIGIDRDDFRNAPVLPRRKHERDRGANRDPRYDR